MLTSYLFDKPGFMNDPVPETVDNLLLAAHCVCGTKLDGFDGPRERHILRSHSESDLGVSPQVLWKEGRPATLVRFQNPNELILNTGEAPAKIQLEVGVPKEMDIGEWTGGMEERPSLALPAGLQPVREEREWGCTGGVKALPGWAKPNVECDPAFRNISARS